MTVPFEGFYHDKKVLVTGDTGFKGSWLIPWLLQLGAEVHGLGLEPHTDPSLFEILRLRERIQHTTLDIRDSAALMQYVHRIHPDVVLHLAAQALVRTSYELPLETLSTNIQGTANLLQAIAKAGFECQNPCSVVVVTSDKCYENRDTYFAYREEDSMGGHDIYSASKGAAELVVAAWRRSFFAPTDGSPPSIRLASCRAGNVIGGGDWALDRIVPDSIRSLCCGEPIRVRNPGSIRPWQHVLEPLSGYLQVGALLSRDPSCTQYCTAWNFGPDMQSERTVAELCDAILHHWGSGSWVSARDAREVHEARILKLSIEKAWHYLKWQPVWEFEQAIERTVTWYRIGHQCRYDTDTMLGETEEQIEKFTRDAAARSLGWTESEYGRAVYEASTPST